MFPPLGAHTAASKIFRIRSFGTGSGLTRRIDRVVRIISNRSAAGGVVLGVACSVMHPVTEIVVALTDHRTAICSIQGRSTIPMPDRSGGADFGSNAPHKWEGQAMIYRRDRVVWGAVLFRTTNPEVVEGAIVRRSERLHWTSQAAKEEVLGWMRELPQTNPAGGIEWQSAEDVTIGRFGNDPNHVAVIRSMLLPLGKAPRMK
jgi:hypothetical protein